MEEYSHNLEKNLEDLEVEMGTLNAMIYELLKRVSKEKDRGIETLAEVEEWISMAEETESKASSLLDESISGCHDLSMYDDISKISQSTLHYSETVCTTLKEVKALRSKGVFKVIVERAPLSYVKKMLPLHPIDSGEMLAEEAWDFFQEIIGETTLKSHPDIPQLARIVCRKCRGLPIALSLIGETMSRKRTVQEWHQAISVLVSSTPEVSGTEDELLYILKFAYDNLPGENIKSCFLYCALFPKSCDINKQDLVDCWIAEGVIEDEDREIAEIQGYEMMADLVMMRLLIDDESEHEVKMHDMVRGMALWIATDCGRQKENFVVVSGEDRHQMPEVNDWSNVRRMSVTSTQVDKISDSHDCPKLTTLFLQENNLKWVSGDFFRWMTSLVVLNLSRNKELSELPEEVSSLVSLRLLNLSWTWIKRLPLGLTELKRLMHLDLDDTPRLLEVDVIGYLLNLQVLRLFRSVPMDRSLLENIQLLENLKELNLTVREVDVLERLQSIHKLASCIRHLHLKGITIKDGGTLLLNSMLSLRELNIGMCDIPEITVDWRSTIQRETIHFGNIQKIPYLQNIRTVALSWCKGLKDLTWLLLAPNLGDLRLLECQQIEHIINKEKPTGDMSEEPFQNLTRLSLESLPQLESIYWTPLPFPVLKDLCIRGCPKLRRRPFSNKGNQVRSDVGQKGVEREDEAMKQHLSNFDDRDFLKMDEDQNMEGLASESHPNKNIALVDTSERGKFSTNANSMTDFDDSPMLHGNRSGYVEAETYASAEARLLRKLGSGDIPTVAEDQKMGGLVSELHPNENVALVETSERGKSTIANSITNFDDRDFPTLAEDQKMDGLASESHPVEDIVLVETLESEKGTIPNSITEENVFQSGKHATLEHTQSYPVLAPDGMIHNMTDTPGGTIMAGELVSFGIQKLWELLRQESERFQGASDEIDMVKSDLLYLRGFLADANAKKHTREVKSCIEEIKEIFFDAEDIIETYLLEENPPKTGVFKRLFRGRAGRKFALDMNSLSKRISKIISVMQAFGVHQVITEGKDSQPLLQRQKRMRQKFAGEYKPNFVGLEENVEKLVSLLVEEDNIQVVSITGMGGLGKTTLARQTFNHDMVKHKFDRFAWVGISQACNRKIVWQMILRSLLAKKDEDSILHMTESELQEQIFLLLEASKSLIVIDDIWKEEDWKRISQILPNTKGWKVLLTSRNENVAGDTRHINFNLELLTTDDSWTLLQTIAFPRKDAFGEAYEEMEKMGKHMIKYCGGLPLAVRILGGLLAKKYKLHEWEMICENVERHLMGRTDFNDDNNILRFHVMSLSFEELSSYLKQCFLYLAIFPEDHRISVGKLSYYWAAEGFTGTYYDEETIRDVGDSYIEELARRNMVTFERDSTGLRFETCSMHDIMREMCLTKAKEENFLQTDVTRRFVCQNTTTLDVERDINNPKLRSLLVILNSEGDFCRLSGLRFTRLQLLRVLDLDKAKFEGGKLPSDIGKLIHLRYLSLESAEVSHLPSSLRNLMLLIYLNIDVADIDIHVPNVLMEMRELRYLALPKFMHEKTKLELGNLVNLETLENFSTKNSRLEDLRCMIRLRTLSIKVTGETSSETLSLSISGLRHLENLVIHDRLSWIKEGIVLHCDDLIKLELFMYRPVRLEKQRFPSHITYISLTECRFEHDPMPLLETLQHLRKVKLLDRSHCARRMVCSGSGFPQLRELELVLLEQLEEWIIEEGSMPLLHSLDITDCNKLKEIPEGLRIIPSLKNLTCYSMGKEWEGRLSEGGEEYYKVQHIPSVKFYGA
ncbi:uncharacterized protein LOC106400730 isoform X4 [Brassica napus]|uniref:uncharacterized protein LOC106400730 isoform X4 n=1 Tax=Brassica napus TaxID=3708 RepID=UPI0006AB5F4F|nr:uncharacterized protein LOC106400730 isoform X4 [Brassica napus]